ncbi:MAG: M23 family metallopeptidase [Hyphomonadaceae bacterium]|nr:M23 family metallopeptidase [Hyphomonadaceae bacterium]
MIKTILTLAFAGATGVGGYLGGSIYPAPPQWTEAINREANDLRTKFKLESVDFQGFRRLVSEAKFAELKGELSDYAAAAGEVIVVERDSGSIEEQLDNLAMTAETALPAGTEVVPIPATPPPPATQSDANKPAAGAATTPAPITSIIVTRPVSTDMKQVFEQNLKLCPRMTVANAPASDAELVVASYKPLVAVQGVKLATFPAKGACLSSGFGARNSRLHKGLDYHSETGAPILAAADGTVVEMKYREDYGNMLLIDHGGGVYTRYAHLASFGKGLSMGVTVRAGEQIGLMGNTAAYQIPMHLHYELLLGDYANPKGSFGLQAADPLSFPAAP